MSYENTGALWTNKYKKSEKHPDFRGSITLERRLVKELLENSEDNVVINMSGWRKETKNGDRFLSLAFDAYRKEERKEEKPKQADDFENVPF